MKVLVLGASGATGRQVVRQLIERQIETRILIRATAVVAEEIRENPQVEIVRGSISELTASEMESLLQDCTALVSCLGHNLTFKGMFGKPRDLVSGAVRKACETAGKSGDGKVKMVLMSTTAYTNAEIGETNRTGEKIILTLLKYLLPPHRDNMKAADYLIRKIGKEDEKIEWTAVRPDTLVDNEEVSAYELCGSPVRSPVFNAGTTSRINVGHFMAELLTDKSLWQKWRFRTPVIYNT